MKELLSAIKSTKAAEYGVIEEPIENEDEFLTVIAPGLVGDLLKDLHVNFKSSVQALNYLLAKEVFHPYSESMVPQTFAEMPGFLGRISRSDIVKGAGKISLGMYKVGARIKAGGHEFTYAVVIGADTAEIEKPKVGAHSISIEVPSTYEVKFISREIAQVKPSEGFAERVKGLGEFTKTGANTWSVGHSGRKYFLHTEKCISNKFNPKIVSTISGEVEDDFLGMGLF